MARSNHEQKESREAAILRMMALNSSFRAMRMMALNSFELRGIYYVEKNK